MKAKKKEKKSFWRSTIFDHLPSCGFGKLGHFDPKINCRIFGLSVSFPHKVKFLDEPDPFPPPCNKRERVRYARLGCTAV